MRCHFLSVVVWAGGVHSGVVFVLLPLLVPHCLPHGSWRVYNLATAVMHSQTVKP